MKTYILRYQDYESDGEIMICINKAGDFNAQAVNSLEECHEFRELPTPTSFIPLMQFIAENALKGDVFDKDNIITKEFDNFDDYEDYFNKILSGRE